MVEANQETIAKLEEFIQRPFAAIPESALTPIASNSWGIHGTYEELVLDDASRLIAENQLQSACERYILVARMRGQIVSRQTAGQVDYAREWQQNKNDFEQAILHWAQLPTQTSQNIQDAITKLHVVFEQYPDPREAVLAHYYQVRDILLDKEPPTFLKQKNPRKIDYLPLLQNMLPWEHERSLRALDLLTTQDLNYVDAVSQVARGGDIGNLPGASKQYTTTQISLPNALAQTFLYALASISRFLRGFFPARLCCRHYIQPEEGIKAVERQALLRRILASDSSKHAFGYSSQKRKVNKATTRGDLPGLEFPWPAKHQDRSHR